MASASDSYDHMVKLLLIGEAGVGKSSILMRFTDDSFDDQQPSTCVGDAARSLHRGMLT